MKAIQPILKSAADRNVMEQFQKIKAFFNPSKVADLKPSAKVFIGSFCQWEALWVIEDGCYKGQWAMRPVLESKESAKLDFAWVPECDLEIVA